MNYHIYCLYFGQLMYMFSLLVWKRDIFDGKSIGDWIEKGWGTQRTVFLMKVPKKVPTLMARPVRSYHTPPPSSLMVIGTFFKSKFANFIKQFAFAFLLFHIICPRSLVITHSIKNGQDFFCGFPNLRAILQTHNLGGRECVVPPPELPILKMA